MPNCQPRIAAELPAMPGRRRGPTAAALAVVVAAIRTAIPGAMLGAMVGVVPLAARGQADADGDARRFVLSLHAATLAAAGPARTDAAARAALERLIAESFDLGAIARAALRGATPEPSPEQQARLGRVLGRRMADEIVRRGGDRPGALQVAAVRPIGPDGWLVTTPVADPAGTATVLAWRLSSTGGTLRVVDVLRDGVSAVIVQRDQIAARLRAGLSLDAAIDEIARAGATPR